MGSLASGDATTDDSAKQARVAVIVPYYQRAAGLLTEALESVFAQSILGRNVGLDLLVIDDHSPRDPWLDIAEVSVPATVNLTVTKTTVNGGPAAARNCGLCAVGADITHVAFLDSDERWVATHLENALRAFDMTQAGLYFANYSRGEWSRDKFAVTGFGAGHTLTCAEHQIYSFTGHPLVEILINATVRIQTCVVRWPAMSRFRFQEALAIGEDSDYVANAVAEAGIGLCFSLVVETFAMRSGVNVSQNTDNDPLKEKVIRLEMLRYQRYVVDTYGSRAGMTDVSWDALNEARYNYLQALVSADLELRAKLQGVYQSVTADRGFVPWCGAFLGGLILRRISGGSMK